MEITFGSKDDVKSSKPTLKKLEVGNSEILLQELIFYHQYFLENLNL
jgi:hypothetical protein